MRVIAKGKNPKNTPVRTQCNNCDTLFEFTTGEAELVFDSRDGDYYKIDCPVCQYTATISTALVGKH